MNEEMVTITKAEYDRLVSSNEELYCLEIAGVDNWEGYSAAMQLFDGEITEDEL